MSGLTVIGFGGRAFAESFDLRRNLARAMVERDVVRLIHGACGHEPDSCHPVRLGADIIWASVARCLLGHDSVYAFPADWRRLGRSAGPLRNQHMLEVGIAFGQCEGWSLPGGFGTLDMAKRIRRAGLVLRQFDDEGVEV